MRPRKRRPPSEPRPVRVSDLRDKYDGRVFLYCDVCGAEYSAYRGDYFAFPPEHVFTCDHGAASAAESGDPDAIPFADGPETPMRLVRKLTRLEDVGT